MTGERALLSVHDMLAGYQLAHAAYALHVSDVLATMSTPRSPSELAEEHGIDERLLRPLLDLLAGRSSLVAKDDLGYRCTADYTAAARFELDQYMGAYGRNSSELATSLRDPSRAPGLVDTVAHAAAYASFGRAGQGLVVDLVAQLGFRSVVDLGCGPASTLIELAGRLPDFSGYGIDSSPHMIATGRRRIEASGLADRITVVQGDIADLAALCEPGPEVVDCVLMGSVLDAFFGDGAAGATSVLSGVRQRFPGSAFIVADYYGVLGRRDPPWADRTVIHDFAQIASGQGVPPETAADWFPIYEAAGCGLIHMLETSDGTGFAHVGRLGGNLSPRGR